MSREQIIIMGDHGGFGGCTNLAAAFNAHSSKFRATAVTRLPHPYDDESGLRIGQDADRVDALLSTTSKLFFCDWHGMIGLAQHLTRKHGKPFTYRPWEPGWSRLFKWLRARECVIFWSGTQYIKNHQRINAALRPLEIQTFAMPDILQCDRRALPLFQCFEIEPSKSIRAIPTACHSPGRKSKTEEKGTPKIRAAFAQLHEEIGLESFIMEDIPNHEAIALRAQCWFFVDKLSTVGGLGKSGLEAMVAGVPTLCDMRRSRLDGYYADCPVLDCRSEGRLIKLARKIVADQDFRDEVAKRTLKWARRLRYKATIKYLESELLWCK